jgi:hypothetical protein
MNSLFLPFCVPKRLLFWGQSLRSCSENIVRVRSGLIIDTIFCRIRTRNCHNTTVLNDMNMIDLALSDENWDIWISCHTIEWYISRRALLFARLIAYILRLFPIILLSTNVFSIQCCVANLNNVSNLGAKSFSGAAVGPCYDCII